MSYIFTYDQANCSRIIQAVLTDKRAAIPAIKNQLGAVIKAYVDVQVALVTDTTVFYKIETDMGNLAGYFTLQIARGGASILQYELCPPFQPFESEISSLIGTFMNGYGWQRDYLQ